MDLKVDEANENRLAELGKHASELDAVPVETLQTQDWEDKKNSQDPKMDGAAGW
ncbi:hypothetical protein [Sinomonas humi]|uniref:hypothetical protein n=1 Tax=Sinomonas humi TaxID=1338436 RepID=UPI0012DFEACF|nr:hypothetical protein [Sinomonas humi]